MTDLEKILHGWNETNQKINNKIDNILPTITAASTASTIDRKSVVFSGTGKALESLKVGGRTVQEGTPTPDAPVEVKGIGDKTKTVIDFGFITRRDDYYLNENGTEVAGAGTGYTSNYIPVKPNVTYTYVRKDNNASSGVRIYFYDTSKTWISRSQQTVGSVTFVTPTNCNYVRVTYITSSFSESNPNLTNFIIEGAGDSTTPYEPVGYKIPVSCNGETTNIYLDSPLFEGETVDFVGGIKDKKWKSFAITSVDERYWVYVGTAPIRIYYNRVIDPSAPKLFDEDYNNNCINLCNYFKGQSVIGEGTGTKNGYFNFALTNSARGMLRFGIEPLSSVRSVAEWKTWVEARAAEGKPLTIWYETTGVTTESFDTSPTPTTSGNNELSINTEITPTTIDVTSFGDYYSKAEVDKMTPKISKIYSGNVSIDTANTSVRVDIPTINTDGNVVMCYASVKTQSTTNNYIYSATFDIANGNMRFNASVAQIYFVEVYAIVRPL